jgi:hypothetical protein
MNELDADSPGQTWNELAESECAVHSGASKAFGLQVMPKGVEPDSPEGKRLIHQYRAMHADYRRLPKRGRRHRHLAHLAPAQALQRLGARSRAPGPQPVRRRGSRRSTEGARSPSGDDPPDESDPPSGLAGRAAELARELQAASDELVASWRAEWASEPEQLGLLGGGESTR